MSEAKPKLPTYSEVIKNILDPLQEAISVESLIDKILEVRPSQAKNPRKKAMNHIQRDCKRTLVFLDSDTILSIQLALQGARFRYRLDRSKQRKGFLEIEHSLYYYLPKFFPLQHLNFVDNAGHPIPFELRKASSKVNTPLGPSEYEQEHLTLDRWLRDQKASQNDHLLCTILDWERGVLQLQREPASEINLTLLKERNQQMADIFWNLLEMERSEILDVSIAIPSAYARLPDKEGYPPDLWQYIIAEDERMVTNEWYIRYYDGQLPMIEEILKREMGVHINVKPKEFPRDQGQQVYRLKAKLIHKPKIWRTIEIQGKQTLSILDSELRKAFDHDLYDHLGGFWRLVARGNANRKRYREVDLGTVYPYEERGEGAKTCMAGIGLQVGDRMKYVYDFGDWVEHILTLEAIDEPQQNVNYPREIKRNKPKYLFCVECLEKGKEIVAEYICLSCTNMEQKEIVFCQSCVRKHNAEHFIELILY